MATMGGVILGGSGLLLWIGRRFIIQGTAVPFLASLFGFLFLALSHNISLFLFTPLFFIYLALVALIPTITFLVLGVGQRLAKGGLDRVEPGPELSLGYPPDLDCHALVWPVSRRGCSRASA